MNGIENMLIKHEANRLKPYLDCCGKYWRECTCEKKGKLTIGVGRNLDDMGIDLSESMYMLNNDIKRVIRELDSEFEWYRKLNNPRRMAMVDMCFNLGISRFKEFKNMLEALDKLDFDKAAKEMLDSKWAAQVGARAIELADIIKIGDMIDGH